jgi:hypothetical protein
MRETRKQVSKDLSRLNTRVIQLKIIEEKAVSGEIRMRKRSLQLETKRRERE